MIPAAQLRLIRESARSVTHVLFIGQPHFAEFRNIPSIGYEETKPRKGSSLAWNIPFIGTARFGASTSRRCIGVPDKQRCAAARTYICEKGLCGKQYPGSVHYVYRRAARPFIGINRFEASAKENVPYCKIGVRPRSSSDVNSNPKQTHRSNMGSIPGKHRPQRGGVNCKSRD